MGFKIYLTSSWNFSVYSSNLDYKRPSPNFYLSQESDLSFPDSYFIDSSSTRYWWIFLILIFPSIGAHVWASSCLHWLVLALFFISSLANAVCSFFLDLIVATSPSSPISGIWYQSELCFCCCSEVDRWIIRDCCSRPCRRVMMAFCSFVTPCFFLLPIILCITKPSLSLYCISLYFLLPIFLFIGTYNDILFKTLFYLRRYSCLCNNWAMVRFHEIHVIVTVVDDINVNIWKLFDFYIVICDIRWLLCWISSWEFLCWCGLWYCSICTILAFRYVLIIKSIGLYECPWHLLWFFILLRGFW